VFATWLPVGYSNMEEHIRITWVGTHSNSSRYLPTGGLSLEHRYKSIEHNQTPIIKST